MRQRWEFKTLTIRDYQLVHLDPLKPYGKEGWELVAVTNLDKNGYFVLFHLKRPIED